MYIFFILFNLFEPKIYQFCSWPAFRILEALLVPLRSNELKNSKNMYTNSVSYASGRNFLSFLLLFYVYQILNSNLRNRIVKMCRSKHDENDLPAKPFTVFPRIISAETIIFWKWKTWKFLYSFRIMAIFYFINWIVAEKFRGGRFLWNRNWDLGFIWSEWPTFLPL